MLSNLKNIFKVTDLRNKILFTLMCVAIYRLGAAIRVPGIDNQAVEQLRIRGAEPGRDRVPQPVLRRGVRELRDLRPRDHAVHHGEHHHAGPRRRDPEAGGVAAGRRGRAAQDHPVDPLPGDRHRHAAGHRTDLRLRPRPRRQRSSEPARTCPTSCCSRTSCRGRCWSWSRSSPARRCSCGSVS